MLTREQLVGADEVYRQLTAHPMRSQIDAERPRLKIKPSPSDNELRRVLAKRVTAH